MSLHTDQRWRRFTGSGFWFIVRRHSDLTFVSQLQTVFNSPAVTAEGTSEAAELRCVQTFIYRSVILRKLLNIHSFSALKSFRQYSLLFNCIVSSRLRYMSLVRRPHLKDHSYKCVFISTYTEIWQCFSFTICQKNNGHMHCGYFFNIYLLEVNNIEVFKSVIKMVCQLSCKKPGYGSS